MGKLIGSRCLPSSRGASTDRTRQLSRLPLFFAPGIDRGDYDVADEFGLCGDCRFGPDNIGRQRRACAQLLRYLPTALSVFPFGEGLLLSSRSAHARGTGASVHRKKRHRQCRKHTGPRLVGLRRDERKNDGSLMEPSSRAAAAEGALIGCSRGNTGGNCRVVMCSASVRTRDEAHAILHR